MESKFIRALVTLGVPGVALGIFYLLLKSMHFEFSRIDATWSALIVILFLLTVGGVIFFSLHRWAPEKKVSADAFTTKPQDAKDASVDGASVSSRVQNISISTLQAHKCSHCGYGYHVNNPLGSNAAYAGATVTCPKCGNVETLRSGPLGF